MTAPKRWYPSSWRQRPAKQQPDYPDRVALRHVLRSLRVLPPIVASWEILALRKQLAQVAKGERFLLQGGDCSERFEDCRPALIAGKLKVLLQMSIVLLDSSKIKMTRVGRIAGQYAKPRSSMTETRGGVTLPAYYGDLVNRPEFSVEQRTPDPQNLLLGYHHSAITLNFIRSLVGGEFSNLDSPHYWDLEFAAGSPRAARYQATIDRIVDSLRFLEASVGAPLDRLTRLEIFTSHECLHLPYEEALTHKVPHRTGWFNQSTHFPWIGDRTRDPQGAHVEYCRGIQNPVGVKVGPSMSPEELLELVERLNPDDEPGKLALIHRFGAGNIERCLPPLVEAIARSGRTVVWCCDPMHGNTVITEEGMKTRGFDKILDEVRQAFVIHRQMGSRLGGIHLELTGENVTECVGGARELRPDDLKRAYRSLIDPRLNHEQALELALQIGPLMPRWGSRAISHPGSTTRSA